LEIRTKFEFESKQEIEKHLEFSKTFLGPILRRPTLPFSFTFSFLPYAKPNSILPGPIPFFPCRAGWHGAARQLLLPNWIPNPAEPGV
jgi:hypothetical protein